MQIQLCVQRKKEKHTHTCKCARPLHPCLPLSSLSTQTGTGPLGCELGASFPTGTARACVPPHGRKLRAASSHLKTYFAVLQRSLTSSRQCHLLPAVPALCPALDESCPASIYHRQCVPTQGMFRGDLSIVDSFTF